MHRWCLLNLTVQGFSLNLTVRGVSNKHCLLTFFIASQITILNKRYHNTFLANSADQITHLLGPSLYAIVSAYF